MAVSEWLQMKLSHLHYNEIHEFVPKWVKCIVWSEILLKNNGSSVE